MLIISIVCGAFAIAAVAFVAGQGLRVKSTLRADRKKINSLKFQFDFYFIRSLLSRLGAWLLPFITWDQRRRISRLLVRAGIENLDYVQIFAFQFVFALIAFVLVVAYLIPSLAVTLMTPLGIFSMVAFATVTATVVWWAPIFWLKRRYQARLMSIERQLPFFLDVVGLGLDAGQNLQAALQLACEHLQEGPLKAEWLRTLSDIRTGSPRSDALRQLAGRLELTALRQLVAALIQGESLGLGMAHVIEVYAVQQRAQRLMRAEKLALQAPIKMLFPLALFIFPCTFLVLGFPVFVQIFGLHR